MKKLKRIRSAFTLAEILITFGIIGIVAAMTMPTLNDRITKRQVEARVKVAYSTIAQVIKCPKMTEIPQVRLRTLQPH